MGAQVCPVQPFRFFVQPDHHIPGFATQGMNRFLRNPEQMLVVTPTDSGHVKFGGKKMITQTKEQIRQFIFDGCQPLSGLPSN